MAGAVLLGACGSAPGQTGQPPPVRVIVPPERTTGPYFAVAVDNHFHDIHPSDYPFISQDRPFIVDNQGRNLHNFTVLGTDISIDIRPGHRLVWPRIGDVLKAGTYNVICSYHVNVGMVGKFVVAP